MKIRLLMINSGTPSLAGTRIENSRPGMSPSLISLSSISLAPGVLETAPSRPAARLNGVPRGKSL